MAYIPNHFYPGKMLAEESQCIIISNINNISKIILFLKNRKEKIIDYKDRIKGINHGNKVISWASVIYTILVALGMGCYFYQVKRTKMVNLGMVILKFILFLVYGIIIYVVFFYLIKYDSFL